MPKTSVVLFAEDDYTAPLLEWLDGLPEKAQDKCIAKIERLVVFGHELRRPDADFLREGIYELRVSLQGVQFRILYFFHGKLAILSHGFIKAVDLGKGKSLFIATNAVNGVMEVYTVFPTSNMKYLNEQRYGDLVWRR